MFVEEKLKNESRRIGLSRQDIMRSSMERSYVLEEHWVNTGQSRIGPAIGR
jgi:hypothetical protein